MITKCRWCGNDKLKFELTPNLIHYGKQVCQHCNKFSSWIKDPNRPTNNRANKKTPRQVCDFHGIEKEICFFCLRERNQLGVKETLTVDHIVELNEGGEDKIENSQVLCSACHKLKNWARLYMHWHLKNGDTTTT